MQFPDWSEQGIFFLGTGNEPVGTGEFRSRCLKTVAIWYACLVMMISKLYDLSYHNSPLFSIDDGPYFSIDDGLPRFGLGLHALS
jgi:hypothetical protein